MTLNSKDLFEHLFNKFEAQYINIHLADIHDFRHHTKPEDHPCRNKYTEVTSIKNLKYPPDKIVCISTTFKDTDGFKSLVGLDVEYPFSNENLNHIVEVCNMISASAYILRTQHGFHILIPEVFSDDLLMWKRTSEFLTASAQLLHHDWVLEYTSKINSAKSFPDLQNIAEKILKEVGHVGDTKLTFIDMRHLAHSILSNERCRGCKPDELGVRTQTFFRVNSRSEEDFEPYLIKEL